MITEAMVINALENVGLCSESIATVHSFLGAFDQFDDGPTTVIKAFQTVLGVDGTLVMPTYTINSFLSKGYYNHEKTPSSVGVLTENFRKFPGTVRTLDPVYSHAVWGKYKGEYGAIQTKDILGKDSIFATLLKDEAKYVLFGTSMDRGCTFIHHFERMVQAPYRFLKTFRGTLVNAGQEEIVAIDHYARHLENPLVPNFNPLEKLLLARNQAKRVFLGRGRILVINIRDLYNIAKESYEQNTFALVKKP